MTGMHWIQLPSGMFVNLVRYSRVGINGAERFYLCDQEPGHEVMTFDPNAEDAAFLVAELRRLADKTREQWK